MNRTAKVSPYPFLVSQWETNIISDWHRQLRKKKKKEREVARSLAGHQIVWGLGRKHMIIILFPSCLFIDVWQIRRTGCLRFTKKWNICKIFHSCLASKQSPAFHSRAITYFYTRGESIKILSLSYNFMAVEITRILEKTTRDNGKSNDISFTSYRDLSLCKSYKSMCISWADKAFSLMK